MYEQRRPTRAIVSALEPLQSGCNATVQRMRQVNQALLLSLIREHGKLSRPQLAKLSGMHRSNVSLIADQLVGTGLLDEAAGQARGRGRVPTLLSLSSQHSPILGINVRPAETTGLLAKLDGSFEQVFRFPTPRKPENFIAALRGAVLCSSTSRRALRGIEQIVLAVPGRLLPQQGLWMPGFPLYSHFPLAEAVRRTLRKPVALANGGNLAAVAAMRVVPGAGNNLAFVAVHDDGIGGGILAEGRLFAGFDGRFAGEFGHMVVGESGLACACGNVGCWGQLLNNRALWSDFQACQLAAAVQRFSAAAFRAALQAASAGDHPCRAVLELAIAHLAVGLRNINNVLNPERIVVAGEIVAAWPLLQQHLAAHPSFPSVAGKILRCATPLNDLYESGAVQHGIDLVFERSTK